MLRRLFIVKKDYTSLLNHHVLSSPDRRPAEIGKTIRISPPDSKETDLVTAVDDNTTGKEHDESNNDQQLSSERVASPDRQAAEIGETARMTSPDSTETDLVAAVDNITGNLIRYADCTFSTKSSQV